MKNITNINTSELNYAEEIIDNEELTSIEKLEILQDEGLDFEDMIDLLI